MEKNIEKEINLNLVASLVLAYLGDTVYESSIREYLIIKSPTKKVNNLHKEAVRYVKASAQANIIHELYEELTEEEIRVYKKGRNQKSNTIAKNAKVIDYKNATGFEALIGYLHLNKKEERLDYIISKSIEIIERNDKRGE